ILHSTPFRRLKHKTQVFFAPSNDHICTRVEHVLHVASIATTICNAIGLNDELAWAIGIGHDLGHTPFGHIGERIIGNLMKEHGLNGFEHEVNGLRVVDFLSPMNLTYAVRDGIVSHCGESFTRTITPDFSVKDLDVIDVKAGIRPSTYEGCVVRLSDQIAYMGRDFEDGVRLGIVKQAELPDQCRTILGVKNRDIIDKLVDDVIRNSLKEGVIGFSEDVFSVLQVMAEFNREKIYKSPALKKYEGYFNRLITVIYSYLSEIFERCGSDGNLYAAEGNMLAAGFFNYVSEKKQSYIEHDGNTDRLIFDFIAGMTDNFCLECANEILVPEYLNREINESFTKNLLFPSVD
ncbi:MAG: HD domain-containing protein, partial [Sphaerochaetaceae bacterium]|nr:HD domain-containing protein [Sphaerochaetaceae bacterium]